MFHWISTGGIPHTSNIFSWMSTYAYLLNIFILKSTELPSSPSFGSHEGVWQAPNTFLSSVTRKSWRHWHQRDSPTSGVFRCVVKLDENDVRAPGATLHHDAPNQDVFGHVARSLLAISNGQFQYLIRISWKIAWRLEDVWFVVYFVVSPWYLTGGSAVVLPRRPSNFKAIE